MLFMKKTILKLVMGSKSFLNKFQTKLKSKIMQFLVGRFCFITTLEGRVGDDFLKRNENIQILWDSFIKWFHSAEDSDVCLSRLFSSPKASLSLFGADFVCWVDYCYFFWITLTSQWQLSFSQRSQLSVQGLSGMYSLRISPITGFYPAVLSLGSSYQLLYPFTS